MLVKGAYLLKYIISLEEGLECVSALFINLESVSILIKNPDIQLSYMIFTCNRVQQVSFVL